MTEDKSRGWFRGGARDTTQLDLAQGTPVPRTSGDTELADSLLGGGRGHDTVQVDRSVFAAERVPSPAVSSGDRAPDPLGDTGSVDVSAIRMRTVEQHLDEILGAVPQPDPIELAVLDAQGLLCAELVVSSRALPSFDQAGLDGYAVRSADVAAATVEAPVDLAVVGESVAGSGEASSISPGLAQKVAVGAMMPAGADVVVPAAWTDQGAARVAVYAALAAGSYVRRTGDDVAPGDTAVQVGTPIGPAQISLLAAVGRERVAVRPRPRVSVLCAGDELVDVGGTPGAGQVVDVNSYALAAAARDAGAEAYRAGILPGDPRRLTDLLESQLLRSDVVLIAGTFASGGVDPLQEALRSLGGMSFTQVAMHPGPLHAFGRLGPDDVPVICVPGEPVAALVAFEVFVRPAIRLMLGKRQLFRRTVQAVSAQQLLSPLGYRQYLHGQVMRHPDGGYVVEPIGDGDQAMLARMARANCLIVVDEDVTEVSAGGLVTVMPMLLGG
ncbi:molybdopterin molybdotransferase [Modestobacter sp. DSM 44400]|uniref:molybdotransferase-like divisome protein Glp n=1 Tax=Modestobacter sp. DSM 44400 TaxID=1550230 RepID=UPI0008955D82|nr:gephyrin-like molybdotransferase Glp [Modestobacter sp. DSM 44400]SDY59361.1 molybdopterin molybdotransferase [Modestobacter sp. DSM 44400]